MGSGASQGRGRSNERSVFDTGLVHMRPVVNGGHRVPGTTEAHLSLPHNLWLWRLPQDRGGGARVSDPAFQLADAHLNTG